MTEGEKVEVVHIQPAGSYIFCVLLCVLQYVLRLVWENRIAFAGKMACFILPTLTIALVVNMHHSIVWACDSTVSFWGP